MSWKLAHEGSRLVGWLADRRVPRALRAPLFRAFARATGADLSEVRPPLDAYPSLGAFFVRRLREDSRPIEADPESLVSPVDGRLTALGRVHEGSLLQAKGRWYSVRQLLAGSSEDVDLEGAWAWTLYLSPRDYHRIHAPETCWLHEVRWIGGTRFPVRPGTLAARDVLGTNERVALRLKTDHGPLLMVLIGALNVGRIRVVGCEPARDACLDPPRSFERGEEMARFELGSTVVMIVPPGRAEPAAVEEGGVVRYGRTIGRWLTEAAP